VSPPGAEVAVRGPEGDARALGIVEDDTASLYFPGIARFAFRSPPEEVHADIAPGASEDLVRDLFRTTVRPLVLQLVGYEALHASSIAWGRRVVAFCGSSGVGKSTVAFGMSRRGHALWGDDVLIFNAASPSVPHCFQIPFSVRLRDSSRAFFNADGELVDGEVAGVDARELAAIVVLERDAREHSITRLEPAAAFPALLPHAVRFTLDDTTRKGRTVENYLEVAARVPVLSARLAAGFDQFPRFLDGLGTSLEELTA
jgi:hypothetical protein